MPTCGGCQVAAIAVAQSASAVRDLGVAGAVSIAAASALGIGYKRGLFDGPVTRSAAGDADANHAKRATIEIPTASGDRRGTRAGVRAPETAETEAGLVVS